jgi:hypothetical protein
MKSIILLSAAVIVSAQAPRPPIGPGEVARPCYNISDIKPLANLLEQFEPNRTNFPCDMGKPIKLGTIPQGCAKFEVLVGSCH